MPTARSGGTGMRSTVACRPTSSVIAWRMPEKQLSRSASGTQSTRPSAEFMRSNASRKSSNASQMSLHSL